MPSSTRSHSERPWILLFVAICLVAANMRLTITGVGPLLDRIAADLSVNIATLGALGAVPLLAWGLVSPVAHALSLRFGLERTVSISLLLLMVGTIWRSLPGGAANIWIGTALTGAALAIGNVLLPAIIKRDFPGRIPLVMGAYTALLGGAGSIAAGVVVPISQINHGGSPLGWRAALLATGAMIPVALGVWVWATRKQQFARTGTLVGQEISSRPSDGLCIWRDPVAWWVALYMGCQSAWFYILQTWLAPLELSRGHSAELAGVEVMVFQLVGVGSSMLIPIFFRGRLRRSLPAIIPVLGSLAVIGMMTMPPLMLLWILLGGISAGASLTMALTLMAVRARTADGATALSGMAQAVGYLIAAAGPVAFGMLFQASGGWMVPLALLLCIGIAQIGIGALVGRERHVGEATGSR